MESNDDRQQQLEIPMLKTILCLSACLTLTSAASYAHDSRPQGQFDVDAVEEILIDNSVATNEIEAQEIEVKSAVAHHGSQEHQMCIEEIEQILVRNCPHCPRVDAPQEESVQESATA